MTEVHAGLEVTVLEHVTVEVGLGPDAMVGCSFHVAGVKHHAGIQLQGHAAIGLIGLDDAQLLVILVQGVLLVVIVLGVTGSFVLVAVVPHVSQFPVPEVHAGGPVEVIRDTALDIGQDAQHIAAHAEVVDVRGLVGPIVVRIVHIGQRGGSIEAPEAVQRVSHIRCRCIDAHARHQILGVIGQIKTHTVAVGEVRAFPADLVEGIRVGGAVAIIIDVSKETCLEAVIHRISGRGQYAEAPASLDFLLFFLLGEGYQGSRCQQKNG